LYKFYIDLFCIRGVALVYFCLYLSDGSFAVPEL